MLKELVLLAAAGAAGTLSRYALAGMVQWLGGERFPWGTLAVNVVGCFLFGLIWTLSEERIVLSGQTRFIVLTGFMGAFTTFSTFAYETSGFFRDAQWWNGCANVMANNVFGVAGVFLGLFVGRWL